MPGEIEGQFLHFGLTQSLFDVVAASARDAEVRDTDSSRGPLSCQGAGLVIGIPPCPTRRGKASAFACR